MEKPPATELYIQNLLESNPLREPLLRPLIQALQLPGGSHGLDAGCGIGLQTVLLLEAVGTDGSIDGLDILPGLLAYARKMVDKAGISEKIAFREGSVTCLPFGDNSFDWAWSADCIGYPAGDLHPALEEMIRVVKPAGSIFILGWSSQQFLPGYPLLEARLNGTCSGYLPFLEGKDPEQHFMRALGALQKAGLQDVQVHTFLGEVQSPLDPAVRTALASLFEMLWGMPQPDVPTEDWEMYRRLCRPESPEFILNIPSYYGFFTYTLFRGKVSK
ncbi:MAG: class I SAM-dependent methyltransferase [Bacteroidota bacterium]